MNEKLCSRKFWMALLTGGVIVANEGLGMKLPSDAIMGLAGVVASYILGQSAVDAKKEGGNG